ncbi:MAG: bacterial transcriptional activator domain-containing protein [Anaerolineae bacterium]
MVEQFGPTGMDGAADAPLHVRMLGHPQVFWNSTPLDIPRRQARALLYRLAAYLAPVPRADLCYLFWPDQPEAVAHRDLSHLLTHLRRAFPAPDILVSSSETVGLNPQRVWADTWALEQALAGTRPATLRRAVALYRGPFLASFSLAREPEVDVWIAEEQPAWERRYLEAVRALMLLEGEAGHASAAIALGERYLATDDLAEDIHRHLITLYAARGERAMAQRQFERCVDALERELGLPPLPETVAAYHAAMAGTGHWPAAPPQDGLPCGAEILSPKLV